MDDIYTLANTGEQIDEADEKSLTMADYVIEQGTSGIWTYEKYHSGAVKMWARQEPQNLAVTTEKGSAFASNLLSYAYPFNVYDATCVASAGYGSTSTHFPWITNVLPWQTKVEFYIECATSVTFPYVIISLTVRGRWKE